MAGVFYLGHLPLELRFASTWLSAPRQFIEHGKAGIVPGAFIFLSGISQSHDELHVLGSGFRVQFSQTADSATLWLLPPRLASPCGSIRVRDRKSVV